MAVIGIDYEGGEAIWNEDESDIIGNTSIEYKGVYLHTKKGEFIFDSGDFPSDWYNAKKKYYREIHEEEPYLSGSSTCNHFIMDGAPYQSAYLFYENEKGVLNYLKEDSTFEERYEMSRTGDELFVDEGTFPTFDELKQRATQNEKVSFTTSET
jgi:hypothetical protein